MDNMVNNITTPKCNDKWAKSVHKESSSAAFLNEYKGKDGQDVSNPSEECGELSGPINMTATKSKLTDVTKGIL